MNSKNTIVLHCVRIARMAVVTALWLCLFLSPVSAQTTAEIIAQARWKIYSIGKGVVIKTSHFDNLLGCPQDVYVTDADFTTSGVALQFVGARGVRKPVSAFASEVPNAAAAINGNWFDYDSNMPIQFTKIGGAVLSQTIHQAQERGGIVINKSGKVSCIPCPQEGWASVDEPNVMSSEIPILVDGKAYVWTASGAPDYDYYYTNRHPRSCIGVTANHHVLFVVVDGRRNDSIGVNYAQMAELMTTLGAVNSTTLDGGGSSTCWVRGYGVLNKPSEGKERLVADALILVAPGGQ